MSEEYHVPVLLDECIKALNIREDGVYVDATFGGGGHSKVILDKLGPNGRLIGFDQDAEAVANAPDDPRLKVYQSNFEHIQRYLMVEGITHVDGILADLGVSSHQIDAPERGFSHRFDGPLDMRMTVDADLMTAADFLQSATAEEIQSVLSRYGEVRNAATAARTIVAARDTMPLKTTSQLVQVLGACIRGKRSRYLSQVFQAIRIAVNREMEVLESFLLSGAEALQPNGRFVIISYHSLEDRLVKRILKTGSASGEIDQDEYGNIYRPFKLPPKQPFLPSEYELKNNPRSRSAKLRVGIKQE